jgi:hypothetical protein
LVVRTQVEIEPDEKKQEIERELSNFVKRENEFMARERRRTAWPSSIQPSKRYSELRATIQRPPKLAALNQHPCWSAKTSAALPRHVCRRRFRRTVRPLTNARA